MLVSLIRRRVVPFLSSKMSTFEISSSPTGTSLSTVVGKLDEFASLKLSEKWDNTGLLMEPYSPRRINKILLTNDLTEDVMDEAVAVDTEMIISYHPPIFAALKSVTQKSWKERIVSRCMEKRIAVYSPHTSWDSVSGGVNDWLASCLPIHEIFPITEGVDPGTGCGRICNLSTEISLKEAIEKMKELTGETYFRFAIARGANIESLIKKVALCAGSGSSVLKGVDADLYITGEMLHHDVLDAVHNGTSVILTNHSNSERGFLRTFQPILAAMLDHQVEIVISKSDCDPLKTV